jgi:hypothetical protein
MKWANRLRTRLDWLGRGVIEWTLAGDDYTSALTTTTLPHGRGMYDMLIRGEEGHGDACNRSASEEVIHGVSEERKDSDGGH